MFSPIRDRIRLAAIPAVLLAALAAADMGRAEEPTKDEVINEVARFTGLAKNTLTAVFEKSPKLLSRFNDVVVGVRVLNEFSEAKDDVALADLTTFALNKVKDQLLPSGMNGAIAAFRAYKTALEVIRDYGYIPKFDTQIYDIYRQSRMADARRGDTSPESRTTAFEAATTGSGSGYYAVKTKMFDEMIKAKGYKKELMGKKFEDALWRKIDQFWMCRLESKLQQDILRGRRSQLENQIWQGAASEIEALRQAAGSAGGPSDFFFTEANMPVGWKLSRTRDSLKHLAPIHEPNLNNRTRQNFNLYPAGVIEKVHQDGSSAAHYTPDGKLVSSEQHRWLSVHISINPAVYVIPESGYRVVEKDLLAERVKKDGHWVPHLKVIREFNDAGVDVGYLAQEIYQGPRRGGHYECRFVKGDWHVEIATWGHFNFVRQDEAAILQICRDVANRIPTAGE